jgi:hypothetical protein
MGPGIFYRQRQKLGMELVCERFGPLTILAKRTLVCRSHDAVIRVYDDAGNVIETHEHNGDFERVVVLGLL